MTILTILLFVKILVSLVLVVLPFLFMSKEKLAGLTGIEAQSSVLYRIYGMAILALLVGYGGGIWQVSQNQFPWGVIMMGLVSNFGASFLLIKTGAARRSKALTVFFICIGFGLLFCAIYPQLVVQSL